MIRIFSSLFFSLIALWAPSVVATVSCSGSSDELDCLEQNVDSLYQSNYYEVGKILGRSAIEAQQCTDAAKTARFLGLVRVQRWSAENEEYFAEVVEELCLKSPDCFNKAAYLLSEEEQQKLKDMLYKHPLFHDEMDFRKAECLVKPDR